MFVIKARSLPFRSALGLTSKHWADLDRPARVKHSSLLGSLVKHDCKKVVSPWPQAYSPIYLMDHDIVLVSIQYRLGALGFLR